MGTPYCVHGGLQQIKEALPRTVGQQVEAIDLSVHRSAAEEDTSNSTHSIQPLVVDLSRRSSREDYSPQSLSPISTSLPPPMLMPPLVELVTSSSPANNITMGADFDNLKRRRVHKCDFPQCDKVYTKVRTSRLTRGPIRAKSPTNVPGKAAHGNLPDL